MKLEHYRIRGNILQWIKSFLSDRWQQVVVDGMTSKTAPVTSEVPQATVLGTCYSLFKSITYQGRSDQQQRYLHTIAYYTEPSATMT